MLADGPSLRWRRAGARSEPYDRLHAVGRLQLRGRYHRVRRVVAEDLLTPPSTSPSARWTPRHRSWARGVTREIPNISEDMISDLDADGIIAWAPRGVPGTCWWARSPRRADRAHRRGALASRHLRREGPPVRDTSLKVPRLRRPRHRHLPLLREAGDDLAPGVEQARAHLRRSKRKVQQGDKLSGRHGNKGVISACCRLRHALPRRRHPDRRHPEPPGRSVPYERRPAARTTSAGPPSGAGRTPRRPTRSWRARCTWPRPCSTAPPRKDLGRHREGQPQPHQHEPREITATWPATSWCPS